MCIHVYMYLLCRAWYKRSEMERILHDLSARSNDVCHMHGPDRQSHICSVDNAGRRCKRRYCSAPPIDRIANPAVNGPLADVLGSERPNANATRPRYMHRSRQPPAMKSIYVHELYPQMQGRVRGGSYRARC